LRYCKAIALLYSHQLPKKNVDGKIYVAIPKWIRQAAYELMKPSIRGLERDIIKFLMKVREKQESNEKTWTYRELLKIAREEIGDRMSINTFKNRYIFPLEDLGFLEIDRGGKTHLIKLTVDGHDLAEENTPILSFFQPENRSDPSNRFLSPEKPF